MANVSASARNFRWMLVYRVSQHTPLFWPFMFVYVTQTCGLPASDFGLLKSVYYLTVMAIDVPLGVVADRLGRRTVLALAALANAASCAVYAAGAGFAMFLCAELLAALTTSLQSGAESALLFDSYAADERTHEFARATGTLEAAGLAGGTVGFSLAGLLLASDGSAAPTYVASSVLSAVGVLASLGFVEPPRVVTLRLRAHVAETLRALVATPGLLATLVYASLVYAALRAANALVWNPVLERAGVPLSGFGALTAAVSLLGAFTAWRAAAIERRLGALPLALTIACSLVAMFALLALSPGVWATPILVSHGLPLGVAPVLIADLLNRRIESSERRATLLSFESLFQRGLYGAIVYFAATALDRHGLQTVLLGFAGLAVLALAFVPRMIRR